jgi:hypothetical protein
LVVTVAHAEHAAGDGSGLYEWWRRAEPPSLREDVAHAFATYSGSFALFRAKGEDERTRKATFQARVLEVYRNTTDVETRKSLARGSWIMTRDSDYPWQPAFLRELAGVESDPSLRDRLLRVASVIETRRTEGKGLGSADLDPILDGR